MLCVVCFVTLLSASNTPQNDLQVRKSVIRALWSNKMIEGYGPTGSDTIMRSNLGVKKT